MAADLLCGDPSRGGIYQEKPEEEEDGGCCWYFSRKEIEENSPSRQDGIDLEQETYLRKSYSSFLERLGIRLKVPQETIATAMVFCHRFFLRQSHGKNDWRIIAKACIFLAGKVKKTPRPLVDVISLSHAMNYMNDPAALQRLKQKDVHEQEELILLRERDLLATLGNDVKVNLPYEPLLEATKRLEVAEKTFPQIACHFLDYGLHTSLYVQFEPHYIAAGAIFVAAKFLKVDLPYGWLQEFDVDECQLEEICNQLWESYEQKVREYETSGGWTCKRGT